MSRVASEHTNEVVEHADMRVRCVDEERSSSDALRDSLEEAARKPRPATRLPLAVDPSLGCC